jgi:hypothetical protein
MKFPKLTNTILWKRNGLKNVALSAALGLILVSCGTHYDKQKPEHERAEDKKEFVLPNNDHVYIIKDWSDTGSPYHFKDEDGNRLLSWLDIASYEDLGDGKFMIETGDQSGIYDFTTNKYILKLDKYTNITKIPWWWSVYLASKQRQWETLSDTVDVATGVVTYWVPAPAPDLTPTPTSPDVLVLWDSLTAVPAGTSGWEFYHIESTKSGQWRILSNCYKPINKWSRIYAITDAGLDKSWEPIYMLHIINTVSNKKVAKVIGKYDAVKYLP